MKHRLLIIQESLDGGGAERILIEYLNNIDYTKYNVSLLLVFGGGRYIAEINKNVHLYEMFSHRVRPKMRIQEVLLLNSFSLAIWSRLILKGRKFDTILSFMEGPALLVHKVLLNYATHHVTWVHTNMITNPWSERIMGGFKKENEAYKCMNDIAFVSAQAKSAFVEKYPDVSAYKAVINNPIDTNRILMGANESIIKTSDCFTVCSIGRMVEAKRFDRLIDAARILKSKGCNIRYWICGIGKLEGQLRNQIHDNNLDNEFVLWGFQKNPYPYLKAADLFVLTSDTEGFPTVICEALVLGKPVISTDVPGTEELLGNSKYGIVCSKNAESVADSILKLYKNKELLSRYSVRALERSSLFDIKSVMDKFYNLISDGCNKAV